jgi:hypothetical protein
MPLRGETNRHLSCGRRLPQELFHSMIFSESGLEGSVDCFNSMYTNAVSEFPIITRRKRSISTSEVQPAGTTVGQSG